MDYVKNRRFGASALGNNELLESASIHENKILGMISKKGSDTKKILTDLYGHSNAILHSINPKPTEHQPQKPNSSLPNKINAVNTEKPLKKDKV